MELELGFKITKTAKDGRTSTDLHISKDHAGPVFMWTETDTRFILKAHLKGFQKEMIKIRINENGSEIEIRGEKPVELMIVAGWNLCTNKVEMRGFKRIFRIPNRVVLDRIKARFNDEEAILTIFMPKSAKGLHGSSIEEVLAEECPETIRETEKLEPELKEAEAQRTEEDSEVVEASTQIPDKMESQREIEDPVGENEHSAETMHLEGKNKDKMGAELKRELDATETVERRPFEESLMKEPFNLDKREVSEAGGRILKKESTEHNRSLESAEIGRTAHDHKSVLPSEDAADDIKTSHGNGISREESQTLENSTEVPELPNITPCSEIEPMQIEHEIKSEVLHGKEESPKVANQIKTEATNHAEQCPKESKVDKDRLSGTKKDHRDQATPRKQISMTKFFIGSAFLASLVALVVSLMKSERRKKNI